jgi:hypothetical protein
MDKSAQDYYHYSWRRFVLNSVVNPEKQHEWIVRYRRYLQYSVKENLGTDTTIFLSFSVAIFISTVQVDLSATEVNDWKNYRSLFFVFPAW